MKVTDYFLTQEVFDITPIKPGILKTSPIPSDLSQYYNSNQYLSHHQTGGSILTRIYKFIQTFNLVYKKRILNHYLTKGSTVLDYGCGVGSFLKYIRKDYQILGVEPNLEAMNLAVQNTSKTAIIASLKQVNDNSLDALTLWHVFEHIPNQDTFLEIAHQKLKKGKYLIIAVPNHASFDAHHYQNFWAAYDVPRHIYHFSPVGMKTLFNNNNWYLKKIRPLWFDAFYISYMSEKYKKSTFPWLHGFLYGAISNFKALKNHEFSSMIYIIIKK